LPNAELKKEATTWLIVSAATSFFCTFGCCFGIAGAVFCFLAMQAADQGNVADAEAKLRWGKIITLCGVGIGFLGTLISLLLHFAAIAASF